MVRAFVMHLLSEGVGENRRYCGCERGGQVLRARERHVQVCLRSKRTLRIKARITTQAGSFFVGSTPPAPLADEASPP